MGMGGWGVSIAGYPWRAKSAAEPRSPILFEVEDATNCDERVALVPDEIDREGKALRRSESVGADSLAKYLRRVGDQTQFRFDADDESATEARRTLLIPREIFVEIRLRRRRDDQASAHDERSRRAFTSGQGDPSAGFAS